MAISIENDGVDWESLVMCLWRGCDWKADVEVVKLVQATFASV